jgi:hypothetical protein
MEREYKTSLSTRQKVHEYMMTAKGRDVSRKSSLKYNHSLKGKERISLYNKTQPRKESARRYYISRKNKLMEERCNH